MQRRSKILLLLSITFLIPTLVFAGDQYTSDTGENPQWNGLFQPFADVIDDLILFMGNNPIVVGRIIIFCLIFVSGYIVSQKSNLDAKGILPIISGTIGLVTAAFMESFSVFLLVMFMLLFGVLIMLLAIFFFIWQLWKSYSGENDTNGLFYILMGIAMIGLGLFFHSLIDLQLQNFNAILNGQEPLVGNTIPNLYRDYTGSFDKSFWETNPTIGKFAGKVSDFVYLGITGIDIMGFIFALFGVTTFFRGARLTKKDGFWRTATGFLGGETKAEVVTRRFEDRYNEVQDDFDKFIKKYKDKPGPGLHSEVKKAYEDLSLKTKFLAQQTDNPYKTALEGMKSVLDAAITARGGTAI